MFCVSVGLRGVGHWRIFREKFSLRDLCSIGHAGIPEPKNTLKVIYSLRNTVPNLGVGELKTSPGNSAKHLRVARYTVFPNGKLFSENQTQILTECHIPAPWFP